jgi:peroxiredoxin
MNLLKFYINPIKSSLIAVLLLSFSTTFYAQLIIGDTIPDLTLLNSSNEHINMQSYKGKVLLIDFWASWCAPCRKANQKLVKLHQKHTSKNVEIVGISLDVDRAKWLKAIVKDKIEYTQLIDPHGFEAKSAIHFGIEVLPASYLFDPSGKLIIINPTEQEIKKQLNQIKQ